MSAPFKRFEAQHLTLVASTNTVLAFDLPALAFRVRNWSTADRVLVKMTTITSDTDVDAARVGKAPSADIPNNSVFPVRSASINLRSPGAAEVTVEAYS